MRAALIALPVMIALYGDPLRCDLEDYKASAGLTAAASANDLTIAWEGTRNQPLRMRLAIENGVPVIQELALKGSRGWVALLAHASPEFRVVSGLRRITNQQLDPLAGLGIKITPEILEKYKWEAFWDAPLNVPGTDPAHNDCTPPQRGVLDQPGLPRRPEEIKRATAAYHARSCSVKTNGARLEISFPGVQLGVFEGRLQFTVYRGSNLVRMEVIAVTREPSVAYKYDAGVDGVAIDAKSRVVWRDPGGEWQDYRFGGPAGDAITVTSANRIVTAELASGAIAAFPPPHNFFWAREISANLGYGWYRQDQEKSFSFGVRQADKEANIPGAEDRRQNFALRSARPGTEQRMPVYFYPSLGNAREAAEQAAAFTRNDHFARLAGYQVMATHFHMGMAGKAMAAGGPGAKIPDLEVLRGAGINIVAPIDGGAGMAPREEAPDAPHTAGNVDDPRWMQWTRALGAPEDLILDESLKYTGLSRADLKFPPAAKPVKRARESSNDPFRGQALYYETAKRQSDTQFVVMPDTELLRGAIARNLGGHSDLLISHPVFFAQGRAAGQPLVEENPTYGRVYHLGTVADMMEMTHRENLLLYMPHPESKGSTGFPEAIKNTDHFRDENYRGIGFRWGMGLDGSEQRLCEYRCLPLWDDMNNWIADKNTPPKYIQAISEIYGENYGDDVYANNPVNYVKLDRLPPPGEWGPIVDAMKKGDYFVTSGEVLIPRFVIEGSAVVADVEWTFPLEFVEIVWGDGVKTGRQVIGATDLAPFGSHRFRIPFDAPGKKWIRFAAWDSAGEGAMAQPVRLNAAK
ncbi:MAG TPA: hypothetical protein VKX39_00740 [Bryobacteraceae bacterium]|jgi:hypothetical protein|nr:hypothetical protein [Bryobacteraceae bacterium]